MRQLYHIPRQINQYMRVFKTPEYIKEHPEVQKKYAMVLRSEHARATEGVSFTCSARILNVAPSTLYAWRSLMQASTALHCKKKSGLILCTILFIPRRTGALALRRYLH